MRGILARCRLFAARTLRLDRGPPGRGVLGRVITALDTNIPSALWSAEPLATETHLVQVLCSQPPSVENGFFRKYAQVAETTTSPSRRISISQGWPTRGHACFVPSFCPTPVHGRTPASPSPDLVRFVTSATPPPPNKSNNLPAIAFQT